MKRWPLLFLISGSALAARVRMSQSGFGAGANGAPAGWTTWSARPETAPRTFVDPSHYRTRSGSLAISGAGNGSEHGGWAFPDLRSRARRVVPVSRLLSFLRCPRRELADRGR